jgi:hypothetical protein
MRHEWHYVYYSYEEWGRGYIGRRTSRVEPDLDLYLGSFTDETFRPTKKIILEVFDSKEEAIKAEIALHTFFQVDLNPHFANKVKQTAIGFSCSKGFPGPRSKQHRQALSQGVAAAWRDPLKKQNMMNGLKRRSQSEKWRQNHIKVRQSAKYRQKMSDLVKSRWEDSEFRERHEEMIKARAATQEWKQKHQQGCEKNKKYIYTLYSSSGEIFEVTNLRVFCQENGLDQEKIRLVATGTRNTHRGWKATRCFL